MDFIKGFGDLGLIIGVNLIRGFKRLLIAIRIYNTEPECVDAFLFAQPVALEFVFDDVVDGRARSRRHPKRDVGRRVEAAADLTGRRRQPEVVQGTKLKMQNPICS